MDRVSSRNQIFAFSFLKTISTIVKANTINVVEIANKDMTEEISLKLSVIMSLLNKELLIILNSKLII